MYEVKPHVYKETPVGKGIRVCPIEKIMELSKNPKFREAVDLIEKFQDGGKPSQVKMLIRKQLVHDAMMARKVAENAFVIDKAKAKAEGKNDISQEQANYENKIRMLNTDKLKEARNPKKPIYSFGTK